MQRVKIFWQISIIMPKLREKKFGVIIHVGQERVSMVSAKLPSQGPKRGMSSHAMDLSVYAKSSSSPHKGRGPSF